MAVVRDGKERLEAMAFHQRRTMIAQTLHRDVTCLPKTICTMIEDYSQSPYLVLCKKTLACVMEGNPSSSKPAEDAKQEDPLSPKEARKKRHKGQPVAIQVFEIALWFLNLDQSLLPLPDPRQSHRYVVDDWAVTTPLVLQRGFGIATFTASQSIRTLSLTDLSVSERGVLKYRRDDIDISSEHSEWVGTYVSVSFQGKPGIALYCLVDLTGHTTSLTLPSWFRDAFNKFAVYKDTLFSLSVQTYTIDLYHLSHTESKPRLLKRLPFRPLPSYSGDSNANVIELFALDETRFIVFCETTKNHPFQDVIQFGMYLLDLSTEQIIPRLLWTAPPELTKLSLLYLTCVGGDTLYWQMTNSNRSGYHMSSQPMYHLPSISSALLLETPSSAFSAEKAAAFSAMAVEPEQEEQEEQEKQDVVPLDVAVDGAELLGHIYL